MLPRACAHPTSPWADQFRLAAHYSVLPYIYGCRAAPGKVDAQLLEDVKARARELGMPENAVAESAFSQWFEANTQG